MTKIQEIAKLREFVSSLPTNSYLHSALAPCVGYFELQIRSDLIPDFTDIYEERKAANAELLKVKLEIEALRAEKQAFLRELAASVSASLALAEGASEKATRAANGAASAVREAKELKSKLNDIWAADRQRQVA